MKLARIWMVVFVVLALAGGAAWWLLRPGAGHETPVTAPAPPAPVGDVAQPLADEISWIGKALAADNREAARERAREAARRDRSLAELMKVFQAERVGGAIEPTLSRLGDRMPENVDWDWLTPSAHATAAAAEVLQFMPPPGSPSVIWNALRQELKEASHDWAAAVRAQDVEQTQRAMRRVQVSCVQCHERYRRSFPSPMPPGPVVDLRAFKNEVRRDIVTAAEFLMRGEYDKARAWTDKIAENTDCAEVMQLLTTRRRGGLGMAATWPDRNDDSIESALLHLEKAWPPADRRVGRGNEVDVMGYQLAAIAEVVKALRPRAKMEESVWRTFTLEFRSAAFDLSGVLQQQNEPAIRAAVKRVNQACLNCHAKVNVPMLAERPRLRTTEELLAMLEAAPPSGPNRAAFLSRKRVGVLDELLTRKDDLPRLGEPFARALSQALADPDVSVRLQSIELIALFHPDVKELSPLLPTIFDQERDEEVREAATQALSRLKGGDAVTGLIRALGDEDAVVRGRAALALSRLGKSAVPELRRVLKAGNRDTRASALGALGRIGPEAAASVPEVRSLVDGDDALLKSLAVDALRKIDPDGSKKE